MPQHFSFTNAPPPPPALYEYLAQVLGPAGAAQLLGGAGPGGGGGIAAQGLATQLAGAQALSQGVMEGVPPPAKHPVPDMDVPKPKVDTSTRDTLLGAANLLASLGGGATEPAAATGGWTPPTTPGNEPSNFLQDLFGGKDASQNLLQFGLRMMAGSQPQAGATVGPSLFGAVGEAGVGTLAVAAHRKAEQARQERRRRKEEPTRQRESARAKLSGGYDPTTDITWQGGRAGMSPEERKAQFTRGYPGQAGAKMASEIFGSGPPTTRTVKRGDQFITEEWNPGEGWTEIGKAPRFKPGERGGPTNPQAANNAEIDEARKRLEELDQSLQNGGTLGEELNRRMSSTDPSTGLLTPDFSSFWGQIARTAMQSKVGVDDSDQAIWSRRLMMPPQFTEPAGAKPLPPGLQGAEPPGIQDQLLDFFGLGGAGAAPTPPTTQPGPMPAPGPQSAAPTPPNPLAGSFLSPTGATVPVPGQMPRAPDSVPGGPRMSRPAGAGTPRAFNPRGLPSGGPTPPGSTPRGAAKPIPQMSLTEIDDLLKARGDSLPPMALQAIKARLAILGK